MPPAAHVSVQIGWTGEGVAIPHAGNTQDFFCSPIRARYHIAPALLSHLADLPMALACGPRLARPGRFVDFRSRGVIHSPHVGRTCFIRRATEETGQSSIEDTIKADMERLRRAQEASRNRFQATKDASAAKGDQEGGLKDLVEKFLIADFFFILAGLAGLAVCLGVSVATKDDTLVEGWLKLWPFVFQPAIGILMAGALVSGGLGWLREQQSDRDN